MLKLDQTSLEYITETYNVLIVWEQFSQVREFPLLLLELRALLRVGGPLGRSVPVAVAVFDAIDRLPAHFWSSQIAVVVGCEEEKKQTERWHTTKRTARKLHNSSKQSPHKHIPVTRGSLAHLASSLEFDKPKGRRKPGIERLTREHLDGLPLEAEAPEKLARAGGGCRLRFWRRIRVGHVPCAAAAGLRADDDYASRSASLGALSLAVSPNNLPPRRDELCSLSVIREGG